MSYPTPGPKVSILIHPNIPKPLHGISPRVVLGNTWWNRTRAEAYKKAGYCCEACNTPRDKAWPKAWLDGHEAYDFSPTGVLTYRETVALCPACHMFIHSGLRAIQVKQGYVSSALNTRIENHGMSLLVTNSELLTGFLNRHRLISSSVNWDQFRMIIAGKAYGPSTESYEGWERGEWRDWKPTGREFNINPDMSQQEEII